MKNYSLFSCPLCKTQLHLEGQSLFCAGTPKRHCFDLASSGYVNLLPPGKESNAHTGDDKEMIRARTNFLELGLYDGISGACADLLCKHLSGRSSITFADAGCGEGYHTLRIANELTNKTNATVSALGFDASKNGVNQGAKRVARTPSDSNVLFAAANLFSLPLADHSLDAVLSLFAPIAGAENARVLKPDGLLLVGAAGKRHLWELREQLYDAPRESSGEIKTPEGFEPIDSYLLQYEALVPSSGALGNLLRMTPFAYKTSKEASERLLTLSSLSITVEVQFVVYRKTKDF